MNEGIGRAEALLCACARRRAQLFGLESDGHWTSNIDWDAVLQVADTHGVTELLLAAVTSGGVSVPPAVRARLERHALEVTGLNLSRTTELADLLRYLGEHGVRTLAFKGPALAVSAYGHLGRRLSSDLDLFVDRGDVSQVRSLLVARGYRVPAREPRRGGSLLYGLLPSAGRDDVLLPGRAGQSMIDVHVAFASWRFGIRHDAGALFDRAIAVDVAGHAIPTLCAEDLLPVLAIHGMMHCWYPLRLVSDVDAVADLVTDWDAVVERAGAARMRRVLWVALLLARRLLGTSLPADIFARASADARAAALARDAATRMFDGTASGPWNRRAWLRSFVDAPHRRLRFVARDTLHEWFLIWPWNSRPGRRNATRR